MIEPGRRWLPSCAARTTPRFWSNMQRELFDRRSWSSREDLASAIFERIEGFYNPIRRHSGLGYRSPNDFEDLHTAAVTAA
ncbi:MAG TPA: IS3 family transposase [Propionicimonas sp.]